MGCAGDRERPKGEGKGQGDLLAYAELGEWLPADESGADQGEQEAPAGEGGARARRRSAKTEQGELLVYAELKDWLRLAEEGRPRVRGDCGRGERPCPFVGCRYHLWNDREERLNEFERLVEEGPDDWGETCALDIADNVERAPKSRRMENRRSEYSSSGEVIGRPGPALERDEAGEERWVWPESPLDAPKESNRAVVGRFLGVTRETVRIAEMQGLRALREDPAIIEVYPWVEGVGEDEEDEEESEVDEGPG